MDKRFLIALLLPFALAAQHNKYIADDPILYAAIVKQDSLFFDAYNHCSEKLDQYADYYAEDLEFYHDKGGLDASKKSVVEGTKRNICGKVTRHLKPGSIEVYSIKDYGAIEMGEHEFHNNQDPTAIAHYSKFIIFWHYKYNPWKITKVVSLH